MPFMDAQSLLTILCVLLGTGLFVRMVAKEKHRRDKHLELRRYEKELAEAEQQKRMARQAASEGAPVVHVAELRPQNSDKP